MFSKWSSCLFHSTIEELSWNDLRIKYLFQIVVTIKILAYPDRVPCHDLCPCRDDLYPSLVPYSYPSPCFCFCFCSSCHAGLFCPPSPSSPCPQSNPFPCPSSARLCLCPRSSCPCHLSWIVMFPPFNYCSSYLLVPVLAGHVLLFILEDAAVRLLPRFLFRHINSFLLLVVSPQISEHLQILQIKREGIGPINLSRKKLWI